MKVNLESFSNKLSMTLIYINIAGLLITYIYIKLKTHKFKNIFKKKFLLAKIYQYVGEMCIVTFPASFAISIADKLTNTTWIYILFIILFVLFWSTYIIDITDVLTYNYKYKNGLNHVFKNKYWKNKKLKKLSIFCRVKRNISYLKTFLIRNHINKL